MKLPGKKRGRPLILGEEMDTQVEVFLKRIRENGDMVNTAIVMATAEGIVQNHDSSLLASKGGLILTTKNWAKSLMTRMDFVKRWANTKVKVFSTDFEEHKSQFVYDVKSIIEFEDIPEDLVINWDHTGINYIPVSKWTMEAEGSKMVVVTGIEDKRKITAVLSITMSGNYLPPQLIYQGTTNRCLPKMITFPSGWHVTCTQNHWANEVTNLQYLDKILLPLVNQKRKDLNLAANHSCLVIFDKFKAQCTSTVLEVFANNNIL